MDKETADGRHFGKFLGQLMDMATPEMRQRLADLDQLACEWVAAAELRAVQRHGAHILDAIAGRTFLPGAEGWPDPP